MKKIANLEKALVRQEQIRNRSKFGKFLQNTLSGIRDDILPGTLNTIND